MVQYSLSLFGFPVRQFGLCNVKVVLDDAVLQVSVQSVTAPLGTQDLTLALPRSLLPTLVPNTSFLEMLTMFELFFLLLAFYTDT